MRVFLGLKEVSGYYQALKQGFIALGMGCTFINLSPHRFQYGGDDQNLLSRWVVYTGAQKGKFWKKLQGPSRWMLFLWALLRHDVFIFSYNTSFLKDFRDLPILKRFGKKIIYQYHGSDGRPPYLNGSLMNPDSQIDIEECIRLARRQKRKIEMIDRYADVIVNNPVHGHFHTRPIVIWLKVGLAKQPVRYPKTIHFKAHSAEEEIRILHCPSNPVAKGTPVIHKAVSRLREKGLKLTLVEVVNQPHAVILDELERCDFVVDQVYADYGMPGFAAEAAWFGKPVVIAGYAKAFWDDLLSDEWKPPSEYCHPDELEASIEKLATDAAYREQLGRQCREFVETHWQPRQVARRYLELAQGNIPPDWLYDPNNLEYWEGCCLPVSEVRRLIREVYTTGGEDAFFVSDKPKMLTLLKQIAIKVDESGRQTAGPNVVPAEC